MSLIGSPLSSYASILVAQIPIFLVWVVGALLSVLRWRRHPKVSFLTLAATPVFFALTTVGNYVSMQLAVSASAELRSPFLEVTPIQPLHIVVSLVTAGAWALILAAIFGWRGRRVGDTELERQDPVRGRRES